MVAPVFCVACGAGNVPTSFPRTCKFCKAVDYQNPTPVGVLLVPVYDAAVGRAGLLLGRRGPAVSASGLWGLPGGYLENGESAESGAVRELFEECNIRVELDQVRLLYSLPATYGTQVLMFSEKIRAIPRSALAAFVPNPECTELRIAHEPETLAFPTHTLALQRWLEAEHNRR